jgi:uncharacterized RDD family membrane protein YckC
MALSSQIPVEVCPNHPEVSTGLVRCARCNKAYCIDCVVELDGKPYDAVCKEEQLRDLRSGTVSAVELAGAWRRFAGMFVDGLVLIPLTIIYFLVVGTSQPATVTGFFLRLVLFAIPWIIYEGFMLSRYGGQTLGKKALGLKVVNSDGSEIDPGQAWKRGISRQLMSITYVLGLVDTLMIFSTQRRTLHDRFARTIVVNWKP